MAWLPKVGAPVDAKSPPAPVSSAEDMLPHRDSDRLALQPALEIPPLIPVATAVAAVVPARNPFFGANVPKRNGNVNIREDFNPFKGKVVEARNIRESRTNSLTTGPLADCACSQLSTGRLPAKSSWLPCILPVYS